VVDKSEVLPTKLIISIVTFLPNLTLLEDTLRSLRASLVFCENINYKISLINNQINGGVEQLKHIVDLLQLDAKIISGHGNVGYGRGHNLAIEEESEYHLILNPDVQLEVSALSAAVAFMRANTKCGLLTPAAFSPQGKREYLCKKYPNLMDLLLRGLGQRCLKNIFHKRLSSYEMREETSKQVFWTPPIVSGCFMLFRSSLLKSLGGFDPSYFLYFEDFDLSLRAAKFSEIAYVPNVIIVHHGGNASRKGLNHIFYFITSAFKFFNRHGWAVMRSGKRAS